MINLNKNVKATRKSKIFNARDIFNIIISVIGIMIAIMEIIAIMYSYKIEQERFIMYNLYICVIIVLVNIFAFMNKHKAIKANMHVKKLEERNKTLLEVTDDVRCFKHDFNNIMQAINGYIDLKDINSLEKYFNSIIKDCHHINTVELLNHQVVDSPALYAVLLNKYTIAKENNILMNIDIMISLKVFDEKIYNISRILGIFLDNAIEATEECNEKIINIQFIKGKNKNLIIIENTYVENNIDTSKLFEKGYTSKNERGNTGLGLWKVNKIIKKDKSLNLITTKDGEMFKQQLEIYENI